MEQKNNSQRKLIIITGANKGIGFGVVKSLVLADKFDVVLTSRDEKRGKDAVNELRSQFPNAKEHLIYQQLDVSDETSRNNFISWLKYISRKVYIFINNAAVLSTKDSKWLSENFFEKKDNHIDDPFDTTFGTQEDVEYTFNTNVFGLIDITEKILPYLEDNGRIVNVSSGAGTTHFHGVDKIKHYTNPDLQKRENFDKLLNEFVTLAGKGQHVKNNFFKMIYANSKAFVNAYTRFVLPGLLKKEQIVVAIHPGVVKTDMGTDKAHITVDEGVVSTLTVVNFSDEEAQKHNGLYLDEFGKIAEY